MKDFYFVADYTSRFYLDAPNILFSAGTSWMDGKWHNYGEFPNLEKTFVDSGGFSFFRKWGAYPFTIQDYLEWVYTLQDKYPIEHVAILDYPC